MTENEKLKHLRTQLKLSQEDFAQSIGLKQGLYSKIERGESQLSNEAASNIISVYRVNPNWWFFNEEPIFAKRESSYGKDTEAWREKYIQLMEENAELYRRLLKDEEKSKENLKNS